MSETREIDMKHEMTEASGPILEALAPDAHLLQPVIKRAAETPTWPVAAYRSGDAFVDVSAAEFLSRVRALAKGFIASGVTEGDRVVLMSHTRLEWLLLDYAILAAGAVTVPAYETSSAEQLQWIVSDSEAVLAILETPAMAGMFALFAADTPQCRESFVIDGGGIDEIVARAQRSTTPPSTRASPPSRSIGWRRSCTRRARPDDPRAVRSRTPTCARTSCRTSTPFVRCSSPRS